VLANRENAVPRPTAHPIQTIVTQGGMYLVEPPAGLIYAGRDSGVPRGADEPMQTLRTVNSLYLVEPLQVDLRGANRARPVAGEPLSTVTARGNHHGITFVLANYTPGWMRNPDSRELGTVTSRDHHALLTYRGGLDDSGDIRRVGEPASTITTVEQHALLDSRGGDEIPIEECTFRMLQPHELKLAQGFTPDYVLHGNKRQQVCQIGNAVPSGPERELVSRVIESLA
jgi:DNA (cytosine-5)-methyltransferase 1